MRLFVAPLILIFLLDSAYGQNLSQGGHEVGNGGDSLAETIRQRALFLTHSWEQLPALCRSSLGSAGLQLTETARRAEFKTQSDLLFIEENGRKVQKEAVNFPISSIIIFHRQSYLESPSPELLIVHELLGLQNEKDLHFAVSTKILRWLSLRDCPSATDSAVEQIPLDRDPLAVWLTKEKSLLLVLPQPSEIRLYDFAKKTLSDPIKPPEDIHLVDYNSALNRVYISSRTGAVYELDLSVTPRQWKSLASFSEPLESLTTLPTGLLAVYGRTSWCKWAVLDLRGHQQWFSDMKECSNEIVFDSRSNAAFFINTRMFPTNLYRIDFRYGTAPRAVESPYHGEFYWQGPVIPGADLIAVGNGKILSQKNLVIQASLPKTIDKGLWSRGYLVTGHQELRRFQTIEWSADFSHERRLWMRDGQLLALIRSPAPSVRDGVLYRSLEGRYLFTFDLFEEALP